MSIRKQCHIISITGGKGGVGKSVLSANLALATQIEFKVPTLLIDLDSKSCGDQNIILNLKSKYTVGQLSEYKGAFNEQTLKNALAYHKTGLAYLSAVSSPNQKLHCGVQLFKNQIISLSQFFNYIFIDVGCDISSLQEEALSYSSAILTVVTPEILAINQTKRILNDLTHHPSALFHLIINKMDSLGLGASVISNTLRRSIVGTLPNDNQISSSLHSSEAYIISQPQTEYSKYCHEIIRKLNGGILQKGKEFVGKASPLSTNKDVGDLKIEGKTEKNKKVIDSITLLKMQIHSELIKEMDLKKDLTQAKDESEKQELRSKTQVVISRLVDLRARDLDRSERARLIKHVLDEALGLGILEELLADSQVTEIMINGCDHIYYEKNGNLELSKYTITSNIHLRNIIERIVTPLGRRIDEKTPYVDARLADGSRVNAIIEPIAMDGPAVTIRKFPEEQITIDHVVNRFHSLTQEMADFLKICIEQGLNTIISGGTGSGKTTLLNVLSSFIPTKERIVTIEDAAELQLKQEHVVRLETRPSNIEGQGEISIRDLIRNSLRMRPDRIIVGECRDGAALDMLSAMNTGHDGSLTTVHANNPREAVARLETLCLMAGMDLPAKAIREQIAGAIDLIIQISRMSDGTRKIKSITEVAGMQGEIVTLQEVFRFKEESFTKEGKIIGQFQASGIIPSCIERFEKRGLKIPRDLFMTKNSSEAKKPTGIASKPSMISLKPKISSSTPSLNSKNPSENPSQSVNEKVSSQKKFRKILKKEAV